MIILASGSKARQTMLAQAGLSFAVDVPQVDEAAIKDALRQETGNVALVARHLAEIKAMQVSLRHPGQIVIGADQMLELDKDWLDKPESRQQARDHLIRLRGRTHKLTSAVTAVRDGHLIWHHTDSAQLLMRRFSDQFLDDYLDQAQDAVLSSVGAYQLEGLGAQLFVSVTGDFFTILGLPLLALLDFLRENGELLS